MDRFVDRSEAPRNVLAQALTGVVELKLAVLFGSAASEHTRPDSDLDVAILPVRDWSLDEELALKVHLVRETGKDVDVVRLDRASTLLAWEVARTGVLLVGGADEFAQFRARAALDHADFAPAYRKVRDRYLGYLAAGRGTEMTNTDLIARKLAELAAFLARARRRRPEALDRFLSDADLQDALGLAVLVVIQDAIDISFHLVADEGWGTPSSYAESFEILGARGVLERNLALEMAKAVGLRNRLAHGYARVDPERLWKELPRGLDAFEQFAQAIARFVTRASPVLGGRVAPPRDLGTWQPRWAGVGRG